MKITNDTSFHWRNYLKPTPPNVYMFFILVEAVIFAFNIKEIDQDAPKWIIYTLLGLQTIVAKLVPFFGRIKEEYEKKVVTVTTDVEAEVTVTEEIVDKPTNP